ncbi:MAG: hypothetical protein ACLTDR_06075 [Adlercreutzia equolifaciens]
MHDQGECETVEGEISKQTTPPGASCLVVVCRWRQLANQRNRPRLYPEKHEAVDANGRPTTETVTGTFDYDFAIGQNQNAP